MNLVGFAKSSILPMLRASRSTLPPIGLVGDYVNSYLRSAEVGYRRSVLKHLCAVFRLCGRPLLVIPRLEPSVPL